MRRNHGILHDIKDGLEGADGTDFRAATTIRKFLQVILSANGFARKKLFRAPTLHFVILDWRVRNTC
jgi:hypothetical protein